MTDKKETSELEQLLKLQVEVLRNIYLNDKVISTFVMDIWCKQFGKNFKKDAIPRYNEMYKHMKGLWSTHLHAKFGKVSLEELLPEEPLDPDSKD